eukprot:scaffold114214_cov30-Tisochrysis_lutea.AAC.11
MHFKEGILALQKASAQGRSRATPRAPQENGPPVGDQRAVQPGVGRGDGRVRHSTNRRVRLGWGRKEHRLVGHWVHSASTSAGKGRACTPKVSGPSSSAASRRCCAGLPWCSRTYLNAAGASTSPAPYKGHRKAPAIGSPKY